MKSKVLFIQPYFGKLPENFRLWLNSAGNNFEFQFLIFTDASLNKYELPKNVKIINTTFLELNERINKKLNIKVVLKEAYKLCDFKLLYGIIFSEYLVEYSHWGYFDTDLIFGNLSKFINDEILDNYPKIGIYGHLTIFKNTEKMNTLFIKGKGFPVKLETVVYSEKMYAIDEMGGINISCDKLNIKQYPLVVSDISLTNKNRIRDSRYDDAYQLLYVIDGRTFLARSNKQKKEIIIEEVAYIHFQKRKIVIPDGFNYSKPYFITPEKFLNFESDSLEELLFSMYESTSSIIYFRNIRRIKTIISYICGTSKYAIEIKKEQQKMIKKMHKNRPKNIVSIQNVE